MPRRIRFMLCLFAAALAAAPICSADPPAPAQHAAHAADPVALEFAGIGRQIAANPDQPAAPLWEAFAQKHADHDLGQLARFLTGIEKLRAAGAQDDAAALERWFDVAAPRSGSESEFRIHLGEAGRAMRTRLKMLVLGSRLRAYYRTNVEYPERLQQLVEAKLARPQDLLDATGRPLEYQPRARPILPGVPRQAYTLRSAALSVEGDELSGLLKALGEPIRRWQVESTSVARQEAYVQERRGDGTFAASRMWKIGEPRGELVLWAVFDEVAVAGWHGVPRLMLATKREEPR